jgi:succinyl-CoA synthetase beta subunit
LRGFRGRPPGDLEALAAAVVSMSRLAGDASVLEAEVNPLIVMAQGEGVVAVDALARVVA